MGSLKRNLSRMMLPFALISGPYNWSEKPEDRFFSDERHHTYRPTTQSDKRHHNLMLYKRRRKNKAAKIARRKNR